MALLRPAMHDATRSSTTVRWTVRLSLALAAVVLGLGSAWLSLRGPGFSEAAMPPWQLSLAAGSRDADPYTRARVALWGLLALSRDESLYYVAVVDQKGRPLRSRCRYRIEGPVPEGRWWSLTAYADDHFLFADDGRRYGVHGRADAASGAAAVNAISAPVAPEAGAPAWIATPGDRGLRFTLRVYQPATVVRHDPRQAPLPAIVADGDCR